MTREELNNLIEQWENAKVDFKREWYWNDNMPNNIKETHKNELVKDLIALTNGDIYSTDKTVYLIVGIDDETRELYDFDKSTILPLDKLKQQLLTLLNNYAQPEFLALEIELVDEVLVISIPPRGSLISLSKDLKLKNTTDKKGTTYYRVGEDIRVASPSIIEEFNKKFNKHNVNKFIAIGILLSVILGLFLWVSLYSPEAVIVNNEELETQKIEYKAPKRELNNSIHLKFIDSLPEEKSVVYKNAQKNWDKGSTYDMREGNGEVLSFMKNTWLKLSEFYEEGHFENKSSKDYINDYIEKQYDYHFSKYQHQDELMGTMYQVIAEGDVILDLDNRIQDLVFVVSMDEESFDYLNWKERWNKVSDEN